MSDTRIPVEVTQEYTRQHESHIAAHAEVDIEVKSKMSGLARVGMVLVSVGILSMLVSLGTFLVAFPDKWYGVGISTETARIYVETAVATGGFGMLLVMLGLSLFFYGRNVMGFGSIEEYNTDEVLEHA